MAEARLFGSGNRLVGRECPDHRSTSRIGNNAQRVVERCIYRQADFEWGDSGPEMIPRECVSGQTGFQDQQIASLDRISSTVEERK